MSQREKELRNQYKISLFSKLVATGFFSGYLPIAPGTAGSLVAVLIYWVFLKSNLQILIALLIFFVLGIFTSSRFEQRDGHDPKIVVVDEIVGMWLSLLFIEKKNFKCSYRFFSFQSHGRYKTSARKGI